MQEKPFSQACENNKKPILQILEKILLKPQTVLEIGSGSGQHSVYFAEHLPHLQWHTSEQPELHQGILAWHKTVNLTNLKPPFELTVSEKTQWPNRLFDSVFTANTTHIMSWSEVKILFKGVEKLLRTRGLFLQYGPIKIAGRFTSASNEKFEQWLKSQGEHMGIRDLADLEKLAKDSSMSLLKKFPMPANNFILVWEKN